MDCAETRDFFRDAQEVIRFQISDLYLHVIFGPVGTRTEDESPRIFPTKPIRNDGYLLIEIKF